MMLNPDKFRLLVEAMKYSRSMRQKFAQWSHPFFYALYLSRPGMAPTADFQREIFAFTEKKQIELCVIAGFRESAKTSICTISFPIWAILSGQAHFVVIASQTRQQSRTHLANIRRILEDNPLLKNDFGPFEEESDEWGAYAITSKKYDARIIAVSTDQAVRGALYKHYRPDLIICDDIEDLNSTRTRESRNKIYNWFVSEIVPLGSKRTRIFVLGNFLHELSLVCKLMEQIESKERDGVCRKYSLIDENGRCLWPGMYPTPQDLEKKRRKVGDEVAWNREYLLKLITIDGDRVIQPDWIQFHDGAPSPKLEGVSTFAAVDLAISESESADYTAVVSARVTGYGKNFRIYILPEVLNKRMSMPDTIDYLKVLIPTLGSGGKLFIESVGFQEGYLQMLVREGYKDVEGVKPMRDKRTRLSLTASLIRDGIILFPKAGADELYEQLIGFGVESHDDLVDAFSMLIQKIMEEQGDQSGWYAWKAFIESNGGSCYI